MSRPRKFRNIAFCPDTTRFVPVDAVIIGPPSVLELEEIEAIRLKDIEFLDQNACAECMHISRPTFQRILTSARRKIAIALVQGNEIVINPHYEFVDRQGGSGMGAGRGHGRGKGKCAGRGPGHRNGSARGMN